MRERLKILFDFDGTVCRVETIPYAASLLGLERWKEIENLTVDSRSEREEYERNLRKRIQMMSGVTIDDFADCLTSDLLRPGLVDFIKAHTDICEIASCNLDCWCSRVTADLGIPTHFSKVLKSDGYVAAVGEILDKRELVKRYRDDGKRVVFVGDSANDIEAMNEADVAIFLNEGHIAMDGLRRDAYIVDSEEELSALLDNLLLRL